MFLMISSTPILIFARRRDGLNKFIDCKFGRFYLKHPYRAPKVIIFLYHGRTAGTLH